MTIISVAPVAGAPLRDQVILVTGGSRGIGATICAAVAAAGADVALCYRSADVAASETVGLVEAQGRRGLAVRADVAVRTDVDRFVGLALERFGRIDGLVNNAGIMPISPFLETTDEEWDTVLRTDLYGAFFACRAVLPHMLRQERGGRIVNVASRLGQVGWPEVAHYTAAKAGVIALTKSLAREFGPRGIRVNAVAPGVTRTDMGSQVMDGEVGRQRAAELPLGRFVEPAEVATAVLFLLSDASAVFTGQTLNPNSGGYMP